MIEYVFPKNGAQHNGEQDRSARRARAQSQERRRRHSSINKIVGVAASPGSGKSVGSRSASSTPRARGATLRRSRPIRAGGLRRRRGQMSTRCSMFPQRLRSIRDRACPASGVPSERGPSYSTRFASCFRALRFTGVRTATWSGPRSTSRPKRRSSVRSRGEVLCAGCGGSGLQQRRRLQDLRRHGHGEVGRQGNARSDETLSIDEGAVSPGAH